MLHVLHLPPTSLLLARVFCENWPDPCLALARIGKTFVLRVWLDWLWGSRGEAQERNGPKRWSRKMYRLTTFLWTLNWYRCFSCWLEHLLDTPPAAPFAVDYQQPPAEEPCRLGGVCRRKCLQLFEQNLPGNISLGPLCSLLFQVGQCFICWRYGRTLQWLLTSRNQGCPPVPETSLFSAKEAEESYLLQAQRPLLRRLCGVGVFGCILGTWASRRCTHSGHP